MAATAMKAKIAKATAAAGHSIFVMTYEALQTNAKRELGRLFAYVGMAGVKLQAKSVSVKITSDDLRHSLRNFSRVEAAMAGLDPELLPQLQDREHRVFRRIFTADGGGRDIADFEATAPLRA